MQLQDYWQLDSLPLFKELIDFSCGSISGVANCLSGYVLDTLKVKMQTDSNTTMIKSLTESIRNQGFMSLFKGIYYPFMTIPLVNAVVFGSYQFYKKIMSKTQLSFLDGVQSGAFSGFVNSIVVSPVQLIKCKMQSDRQKRYTNSKECLKDIIKKKGFRGIFQGLSSTIFRQVPAYAGQFAAYQQIKSQIISQNHPRLTFAQGCFVGSLAGVACWVCSYPQDVIKTRIQLSNENYYQKHRYIPDGGILACSKEIYKQTGWKGFWRGVEPCMLRAFIANGIGISVYQKCQQLANKNFKY